MLSIILKNLLWISLLFLASFSFAEELPNLELEHKNPKIPSSTQWRLERSNFYFENDIFLRTDSEYTNGVKFSNVYFIPSVDNSEHAHFISFGLSQQMFTPKDIYATELIKNDRPYAGWLNFEVGYHLSSAKELNSFIFQIGVVGKASGAEYVQKETHRLLGNDQPQGWDNQLNNEIGINFTYQHKWRYVPEKIMSIESNIIPFVEASLGNIKTNAAAGVLLRFGWNPVEDFGSSSIDMGGENGIPIRTNCLCPRYKPWSFTFNFSAATQAVARNIFLDGNTFSKSHSVEKENFLVYGSYGFSARYEHFALDYIVIMTTKHFKEEDSGHDFGTILFSYLY